MLVVGSIVIRVTDLEAQSRFWCAALDLEPRDLGSPDFRVLRPRSGQGANISLDLHHSARSLPPRIHLDLYSDDQEADVARLLGLGAKSVDWPGRPADADYIILEDPEGNRFCVVQKG